MSGIVQETTGHVYIYMSGIVQETTGHVYIYMSGIVFDSFSTIGYWNFSDDVIFFACSHFRLGIGTVPTMCYFVCSHFRLGIGTVLTM